MTSASLLITLVSLLLLRARAAAPYGNGRQLKVAFMYPTSISDFGFTYSNEIARVTVERELLAAGPPTKSLPQYLTYLTKIHH
jgi:hypothetical protein